MIQQCWGGFMLRLRLTQFAAGPDTHRVQVDLDDDEGPVSAVSQFQFALSEQDREDLRWYLEDYLEYPIERAPAIAARVEQRQAEVGINLFKCTFSDGARDLWATLRDRLRQARADAFVRTQHQTAQRPRLPRIGRGERMRVLLVICRPRGHQDVPLRSVASHLVWLSAQARNVFQLDVLRTPTIRRLDAVLRAAVQQGAPYHVVHFDGVGGRPKGRRRSRAIGQMG